MRTSLYQSFLVVAFFMAPAPRDAWAQTSIVTKKATVTLSGRLDLNTVYRSQEFFSAMQGDGNSATAPPAGDTPLISYANSLPGQVAPGGSFGSGSGDFFMDPYLALNFAVDVGDQARGVIELRTPFHVADAGGKNDSSNGFFSGFQERTLELKQAYAEIDEIFAGNQPGGGLLLRAGIMDFRKDLRGDGNSFVIDVSGSEHPFDGLATFGATHTTSTGFADTTEAAGGYARYTILPFLILDGWLFNLDESYNASTAARNDLLFWGFSGEIPIGKDSRLGKVFLTVFDLMNTSNTHVVTEGGGFVVYPWVGEEVNFLEIFAEAYFQQGTYARNASVSGQDLEQKDAFALNLGLKGKLPPMTVFEDKKFIPFGELSYVEVSGDDNSQDTENSNFVSLENNNRTLIVENGYYGFDIDHNYRGFRAALGFHLARWRFEALYAYFEFQDNGQGRIAANAENSGKIGDEIDFSLEYEYNANLKFGLHEGLLLDSRALGQSQVTQLTLFTIGLSF